MRKLIRGVQPYHGLRKVLNVRTKNPNLLKCIDFRWYELKLSIGFGHFREKMHIKFKMNAYMTITKESMINLKKTFSTHSRWTDGQIDEWLDGQKKITFALEGWTERLTNDVIEMR